MDDMEQARLVRTALAMAIDRELLNDAVLSGLGWPVYIPYHNPKDPHWQSKWEFEYDPQEAERLLDQAGYPRKANGVRFEMPLFAWPSGTEFGDLGDAVGTFWQDIGVKVDVQHYEYSVFRPGIVAREHFEPWTDVGPLDAYSGTPWDWPRGVQPSTLSRGGKGHGVEAAIFAETYRKMSAETDLQKRIEMSNALADWTRQWVLGIGLVASPSLVVYNPNSIADWDMEPGVRAAFNSPENITLP